MNDRLFKAGDKMKTSPPYVIQQKLLLFHVWSAACSAFTDKRDFTDFNSSINKHVFLHTHHMPD